ncbi:MAG: DUF418 domain-containing protein [Chitinophagaceae bacterium]
MSLHPSTPSGTAPDQVIANEPGNLSRLFSLDVLRGIALLGILVISIWEFGGFTSNEQTFFRQGTHGGNYKLLSIVSILFEGKMRALFALVFGAGIILFMQKKEHPAPLAAPDAYIRRQIWLIIFGVFNAFVLLWPGDILFQYGVVGILLFAFWRMPARGLLIAAILCTLIYCGKQYWNYADDKKDYKKFLAVTAVEKKFKQDSTARAKKDSFDRTKDTVLLKDTLAKNKLMDSLARKNDTLTKKQAGEKGRWEGMIKELKYDSSKTVAENKAIRASYGKVWKHLMQRSQNKESNWLYRTGVWDISSMMLLGMALLGFGFFNHRMASSRYLLIAVLALAIGFTLAWFRIHFQSIKLADYARYIEKYPVPFNQFFPIERMLLATGYASLVMVLLRSKFLNWLWQALAATGKMALTNYIMQTIICTFFFYGYGFGYFGRLQQWQLYFMVAEIALVQIVFSVFWLRYFTMGPLEWLWRCLIYRKWLPWKIKEPHAITDSPAL